MSLVNQLVDIKLSVLCIGHDNVHVIFVSEISLLMLNLAHFLSHRQLPYITTYCVTRFSFQHFKFFVFFFLNFTEICVI